MSKNEKKNNNFLKLVFRTGFQQDMDFDLFFIIRYDLRQRKKEHVLSMNTTSDSFRTNYHQHKLKWRLVH